MSDCLTTTSYQILCLHPPALCSELSNQRFAVDHASPGHRTASSLYPVMLIDSDE